MPDASGAAVAAGQGSVVSVGRPGLWPQARAFVALALPMTVSRFGVAAMGIADGVMLARYSSEQLAVLGQADALIGRLLDMSMVLATAGLALAAQARAGGAPTERGVGTVWHHALMLGLLAGLAGLLFGLFGTQVLALLGQPETIVSASGQVIWILSLGILPALMALASAGLLEALGRPIGVAVAVVAANALNLGLNVLLIYGHGSLPAMGAAGAAWSTTVVRWVLAVVLVGCVWWMSAHRRYGLRGRGPDDGSAAPAQPRPALAQRWLAWWRQGHEQRLRGWAGLANVAVLAILSLSLPVMAGWLGTGAVAQVTALWLALAPMMMVAWGMGDAAGLRAASLLGQPGGQRQLQKIGNGLALVLVVVVVVVALPYMAVPEVILRWAAHEPELVASLLPLVPLGLTAVLAEALAIAYTSMLRSLSVLRAPFIVQAVTGGLLLPLAWYLTFRLNWGVKGLLAAHMFLALARALAVALIYDTHTLRLRRRRKPAKGPK